METLRGDPVWSTIFTAVVLTEYCAVRITAP